MAQRLLTPHCSSCSCTCRKRPDGPAATVTSGAQESKTDGKEKTMARNEQHRVKGRKLRSVETLWGFLIITI